MVSKNSHVGSFYVHEQVEELHNQDLEEMENLTVGMDDAFTNEDVEAVELDDDPPRVSFGPDQYLV
jgi:hypothetical protein